jgi:hypothetical protein
MSEGRALPVPALLSTRTGGLDPTGGAERS